MSQLSPIQQLTAAVRSELGLGPIANEWTYEQRIAYNKRLAERIRANPTFYGAGGTLQMAEDVARSHYAPLEGYGVGARVSDFFGEMTNQAQDINPFSERNRGKTSLVLVLLAALAVYIFTRRAAPAPSAK